MILNETKQKTKVAESYRNPVFEEFSSTFIFPVGVNINFQQIQSTLQQTGWHFLQQQACPKYV